jgi:hypothetical protein
MVKTDEGVNVFKAAQQWQPSFPMVLDRIDGTWVVVGWVTKDDGEAILRVRISFSPDDEIVQFRFDVAPHWTENYVQVAEAKSSCLCGCGLGDDAGLFAGLGVPELWREEFRQMVRRWAAVSVILEPMDEYTSELPAARLPSADDRTN